MWCVSVWGCVCDLCVCECGGCGVCRCVRVVCVMCGVGCVCVCNVWCGVCV